MDAKTLFGYVMLYRVQMWLFAVVDNDAAELVQEHRYRQFVGQPGFDLALAQAAESQLNSHCSQKYTQAVPYAEWRELQKAADLRSMMNARYMRTTVPQ
jgi:hypothetical protein